MKIQVILSGLRKSDFLENVEIRKDYKKTLAATSSKKLSVGSNDPVVISPDDIIIDKVLEFRRRLQAGGIRIQSRIQVPKQFTPEVVQERIADDPKFSSEFSSDLRATIAANPSVPPETKQRAASMTATVLQVQADTSGARFTRSGEPPEGTTDHTLSIGLGIALVLMCGFFLVGEVSGG